MLVGQTPCSGPLERRAHEQRPFFGRGDDDRRPSYASNSVTSIALNLAGIARGRESANV